MWTILYNLSSQFKNICFGSILLFIIIYIPKGQEWILKYCVDKSISKILRKITQHSYDHMWPFIQKYLLMLLKILKKIWQNLLWTYLLLCYCLAFWHFCLNTQTSSSWKCTCVDLIYSVSYSLSNQVLNDLKLFAYLAIFTLWPNLNSDHLLL